LLRILVRDRLLEGDSDTEVVEFIVDRYGEYVLLNPMANGANWLLWGAGPLMLLIAGGMGGIYLRGRSKAANPADAPLTPEERARLDNILKQ